IADDQHRFAGTLVQRLHRAPVHRHAHAQAHCLREGLLGGKPCGQEAHAARGRALAARVEFRQFLGAQDALREALAMAGKRLFDAVDMQKIEPDTGDGRRHDRWPPGARASGALARIMSAFMSRTAFSQPSKTACATMAWPILSSEIPSSLA